MKTSIPTISLIASLAFGCATTGAQQPAPQPGTPLPKGTATATSDDEFAAATETALAAGQKALEAQTEALEKVNERLWKVGAKSGRAAISTRSLVIPKDAGDIKSLAETEEDMSVMARILEKATSGKSEKEERYSSYTVWGIGGQIGTPKNLYIDGYGALFFLNVNFPLLPPATKEKTSESKSEAPSEWETTRNELFHPQGKNNSDFYYNFEMFDSSTPFAASGPAEEYDEDKVTELKENLTAALKNASHIRRLKGDDTVTVIVSDRGPGSGPKVAARRLHTAPNAANSFGSSGSWAFSSSSGSGGTQTPPARLIIRAKRSDIESFQREKLSADDFRKKVTMFVY